MSANLSILIGEFGAADRGSNELISEWASANILQTVARVDLESEGVLDLPRVLFSDGVVVQEEGLFDLLTARRWRHVTVIALREANLGTLSLDRFNKELAVLEMVRGAFADSNDTTFRSCTCSIIETKGVIAEAFNPMWGMHLAQEPVVRIDPEVAAQPMRDGHRASLVSLLALMVSGSFTWQRGPLLDEGFDETRGDHKPIRLARAFLRVVNAGRLTDNVLSVAFPMSGPWSVPGDLMNARSVPPGTLIPEYLITELGHQGSFAMRPLKSKIKSKGTKMGMRDGIRFFFKEFAAALQNIPRSLVAKVRNEVEGWVQKVTFGADSSISLKFDPLAPDLSQDEFLDLMQSLNNNETMDAIGESLPWELLQRVALGLVDGGKFPDSIKLPTSGVHRLVFTDPASIGPAPSFENFSLSPFERAMLSLNDDDISISPVDVIASDALQTRFREVRELVASGGFGLTEAEKKAAELENSEKKKTSNSGGTSKDGTKKQKRNFLRRKKNKSVKAVTPPPAQPIPSAPNTSENKITKADSSASLPSEEQKNGDAVTTDSTKAVEVTPAESKVNDERHRPNHPDFNPTEYVLVTSFYQGQRADLKSEFAKANEAYAIASQQHKPINGFWSQKKACDHCGTRFDYGVLYMHHPTQQLVHVGNVCARKAYGLLDSMDYFMVELDKLEGRWKAWLAAQSKSLLWRVGTVILQGLNTAQADLKSAIELLSHRPGAHEAQTAATEKFGRWTRRGVLVFLLLLAASIACVIFTPLPILFLALTLFVYLFGLISRLVSLGRELVRARFRLSRMEDEYERAYERGQHSAREIVRLLSVAEQFGDWQAIIREVAHVPFGRELQFGAAEKSVGEINRPPSFVLATARPEDLQQMKPFLNARSQTIHSGWLTEIMDVLNQEWKIGYQNSRILSPGDNIIPESDNASPESVVGRHPITNDKIYYPRSDFRRRLVGGRLQKKLVQQKSQMIAEDLRRTPVETLLGAVEISGPGSALSGMGVREFLSSLETPPDEAVPYLADLISDTVPHLRNSAPEMILPKYDEMADQVGHVQVEPGVEFTAATWIVELSDPIGPLSSFRGHVSAQIETKDFSTEDTVS